MNPAKLRRGPLAGRRRFTAARAGALLAVSALAISACGSSATASTHGGVISFQLWESHNGPPVGTEMSALVSKFNATHKNIKVSIVVTKASTKLQAAIAAGDPPVLAEISHYDGQYISAGALVSWNSFLRGSSVVNATSMLPAAWSNGEVNGQHYRLLADLKVSEVFYNKTMFAKAGIAAAPTTWAQLKTDIGLIKKKLPGVIPLGWKDSSAHILPAFMSNGGSMLAGGSETTGHAVQFDTAAGRATFSYFRSLYAAGGLQFHHGTTLREDLAAGKIAMIDGTSAGYRKVLDAVAGKFPVGAFVEPAGSTGRAYNLAQGLGFVLPKGHTRAQDQAAWTFVQWWFGAAQQANWAETTGFDPETHAGIAAIPAAYLTSHPGLQASLAAATSPYTFGRPIPDNYNEVQASLDTEFYNAVTGRQSVSAALATLDRQGDSYLRGASEI